MTEKLAVMDVVNVGRNQGINHAHIRDGKIILHKHDPSSEPEQEEGIVVGLEDWKRIMTAVYWKREEMIESEEGEGTNLVSAEVHVGYVVFRYKSRTKISDEEVSVLSLKQVDARIRRRMR